MFKKVLIMTLCLFLLLGAVSVFADTPSQQEAAGQYLQTIGLYKGYADGTLGLERSITRAEFSTLVVRMLGEEAGSKQQVDTVFKDVKAGHWGSGYIHTAVNHQIVVGYSDNTFKPEGNITYAEALTMMVRLLGYEDTVTGEWPQSHIIMADTLGITKGLKYDANHIVNRGDVALMIRQSLNIELK